jgi:hypothetical protein
MLGARRRMLLRARADRQRRPCGVSLMRVLGLLRGRRRTLLRPWCVPGIRLLHRRWRPLRVRAGRTRQVFRVRVLSLLRGGRRALLWPGRVPGIRLLRRRRGPLRGLLWVLLRTRRGRQGWSRRVSGMGWQALLRTGRRRKGWPRRVRLLRRGWRALLRWRCRLRRRALPLARWWQAVA